MARAVRPGPAHSMAARIAAPSMSTSKIPFGGRVAALAAPVLPVLAGTAAAVISWQRWITPFVDSSREMSVPWRLSQGERLYRDVAYYYGPVGPWLGAVLLRMFGRHWAVLEAMCSVFATLLVVALYRLTKEAGSRLSATVAATAAAALCVGAPLGGAFLFPYSIDSLIAVAAGLAALALTARNGPRQSWIVAGAALGIALGARVEIGSLVLAIVAIGGLRFSRTIHDRRWLRVAGLGAAIGIVIYGVAFFGIPLRDLWPEGPGAVFSPPGEWRAVYRLVAGLDDPAAGFRRVATSLFLDVIVVGGAWLLRKGVGRLAWVLLVAGAVVFSLTAAGRGIDSSWPPLLASGPLLAIALAAASFLRPRMAEQPARFFLFGFAAVLASRVLLGLDYGQRPNPYSILALPGICATMAVLFVDLIPLILPRPEGVRLNAALVFIGIGAVGLLHLGRISAPERYLRVATPAGSLRLPLLQAAPTAMTLGFLRRAARPGDTLASFPEAGIFNFTTGLRNPLREEQILPGFLGPAEEDRVIDRFRQAPPRFVLLINQPAAAFGEVAFGEDYCQKLWAEIERSYRLVASFGTPNFRARIGSQPFFIRVYERLAASGLPARGGQS